MEEGIDYYVTADGKYVFTEVYLKRRGVCCKLNCRHCPYGSHPGARPYFIENRTTGETKADPGKK